MYSRITNMNSIEDFGTISSETCLKDIPYPKKNQLLFSSFCSQQVLFKGRGRGGVGTEGKVHIYKCQDTNPYIETFI